MYFSDIHVLLLQTEQGVHILMCWYFETREALLEKAVPITIAFIDDPMKKVTRYLVGGRLFHWSK